MSEKTAGAGDSPSPKAIAERVASTQHPRHPAAWGAGKRATAQLATRLHKVLARLESDVVLANGVRAATVATPSAWWGGWPVVWAKHDHAFDGPLTRMLGAAAEAIVAPSEAVGAAGTSRIPVVLPLIHIRPTCGTHPQLFATRSHSSQGESDWRHE